jgi:hypothetical protein
MHLNQTSNNVKDFFLNSDPKTMNLNTDIKTAKNLDQILKDIETYRNQLHNTHGSIDILTYSSSSKRCCCNDHQSNEICKQSFDYENEISQTKFVEYKYKITNAKIKNTTLN